MVSQSLVRKVILRVLAVGAYFALVLSSHPSHARLHLRNLCRALLGSTQGGIEEPAAALGGMLAA
jgi:hypothetical protein